MKKGLLFALTVWLVAAAACASALNLSDYTVGPGDFLLEYRNVRAHTAAIEREGSKQVLVIYDEAGRLVCRREMGSERRYDVAETAAHPQGGYLAALVAGPMNGGETMRMLRIDEHGKLLWETAIPKGFSYNWTVLCGDGAGGAYFVFADTGEDPDAYKRAQVWRFDAQGNVMWNRVIEAEGLIFSSFTGRYDDATDRLLVAGHAVSKSKAIYDVVVLAIDREGNMDVIKRKDFSVRPDYGFDVLMDKDGAFYAHSHAGYLNTTGTPHVLVPIDDLPDAKARPVVLRKEDAPTTYYVNTAGGRRYHVTARCGSIDAKYYGSMAAFDADALGKPPYASLEPCSYCGAMQIGASR